MITLKMMVRINIAFVLLCTCILNPIITNPNYMFRDLCKQLAEIEHGEYIDSISVTKTTIRGFNTYRFHVYLCDIVSISEMDMIGLEIINSVDACIHYATVVHGNPRKHWWRNIYVSLAYSKDRTSFGDYGGIGGERIATKYYENEPPANYWDFMFSYGPERLITPYNHPYP
ncbi:MAG: hypothetical protein FWH33_00205 [Oscillospiraceae bacterium]|nr:hypothetical protein [Oscillospiraceae bacterium]